MMNPLKKTILNMFVASLLLSGAAVSVDAATPAATPTWTPTSEATPAATSTWTPTSEATPVATATWTPTTAGTPAATSTPNLTPDATLAATNTMTATPMVTVTPTSSITVTSTPTIATVQDDLFKGKAAIAYPNPAKGKVTIALKPGLTGVMKVRLFNVTGEKIAEFVRENETTIEWITNNVAPGIYLYQVIVDDKLEGVYKLAIVK